jgi:hypothetical protein
VTAVSADTRTSEHARPRLAVAGIAFVAIAVVLLYETVATSDRPAFAVVWAGLALGSYAFGLICLVGVVCHTGLGLASWKIGPWMLLWYGVTFGIATVSWRQPQTTGASAEIAVSSVLRALWLVGVGMTAWALGYCFGLGQPIRSLVARLIGRLGARFDPEVRSLAAPWILYAVGVAARIVSTASTNRFGYVGDTSTSATGFSGILGALSLCAPLAITAAALQVFREHLREARITLAILFLAELATGAAAGGKASFVIAVLAVVIPFGATRRRLPKGALIVSAFVFLVVVIPFNQAYRSVVNQQRSTLTPGQAIAAAPGILRQVLTVEGVTTILPNSFSYLTNRIREIDNPAIVVQRTPGQVEFLNPIQLVEGPIAGMVPRSLWPNKPVRVTGLTFTQEFYEDPEVTSSTDTVAGGLYWYGGWIPVVVGMLLLGCAVRLLDDVLDVRANPQAIFFVILLFPILVGGEEDWGAILSGMPATIFVWILAVFLTFRPRRHA